MAFGYPFGLRLSESSSIPLLTQTDARGREKVVSRSVALEPDQEAHTEAGVEPIQFGRDIELDQDDLRFGCGRPI